MQHVASDSHFSHYNPVEAIAVLYIEQLPGQASISFTESLLCWKLERQLTSPTRLWAFHPFNLTPAQRSDLEPVGLARRRRPAEELGSAKLPKCEAGKTPRSSSGLHYGCPLPGASVVQLLGTQLNSAAPRGIAMQTIARSEATPTAMLS